jgi:hypothetical protein
MLNNPVGINKSIVSSLAMSNKKPAWGPLWSHAQMLQSFMLDIQ